MRKQIIFPLFSLTALCAFAQQPLDWSGMNVIPDSYCQKIGKDGVLVAGETSDGSYYTHNTVTGKEYYYLECHGGMGNSIAENGWMVGSDKNTSKAVVLYEGDIIATPSLKKYSESYFYGITWDASRICGLIINPDLKVSDDFTSPNFDLQMYVPVYLDVDADGTISDPRILPHPDKDFFEATPQYCSAVWISDDGKTIVGQVIDNTGFYMYPIVYTLGEDGEWSYSLPSESLFNQTHLEVPIYPPFEMEVHQITDFMSPEKAKEFEEALNDPNYIGDPYEELEWFMTPEQLEAYLDWEAEYMDYSYYYNNVILEEYYSKLVPIIQNSVFFQQGMMALNSEGTLLATPRSVAYWREGFDMPLSCSVPYMFNLAENTNMELGNDPYARLNTNQVLPDGTLVCCTPNVSGYSPDATPVHSYVLLPGAEEFIQVADWVDSLNPTWGPWMKAWLYHDVPVADSASGWVYKSMYVTGLVAVSDDLKVLAGGVDGWSWDYETGFYFTYILEGDADMAGVETVDAGEPADGMYRVYNLQGLPVMTTSDKTQLQSLPKGLYIVNGKKIVR